MRLRGSPIFSGCGGGVDHETEDIFGIVCICLVQEDASDNVSRRGVNRYTGRGAEEGFHENTLVCF